MKDSTRKILDSAFTAFSRVSLFIVGTAVIGFILPIALKGIGAFMFTATVEHEKFLSENLDYSLSKSDKERIRKSDAARQKLWEMIDSYESSKDSSQPLEKISDLRISTFNKAIKDKDKLKSILSQTPSKRAKLIKEYAEGAWKAYADALDDAERGASGFLFQKFISEQERKLESDAEIFAEEICKGAKISRMARNSLRRNFITYPISLLNACRERFAEKNSAYLSMKGGIIELIGPRSLKEKEDMKLTRQKYGQTRLDIAQRVLSEDIAKISIRKISQGGIPIMDRVSSKEYFGNSVPGQILEYVEKHFDELLQPHFTIYPGFFTDNPIDANIFGGIYPMILGTFYLTVCAMIVAAPLGIAAAIYFSEYAGNGRIANFLRMCVGTLAGVPSIVFGLFGLAFLINTIKVSDGKSVFAGSLTLALLILPTIIRTCEESLKAVPNSYREGALGLGAGKWRAICGVILPAALPSMLTGIIISMGRAAGETAPIIFTAATSAGLAIGLSDIFTQPTPALPWNIYNICSEHEMAERVGHVQYGMALTLICIVLFLNLSAIFIRAKLQNANKNK